MVVNAQAQPVARGWAGLALTSVVTNAVKYRDAAARTNPAKTSPASDTQRRPTTTSESAGR